MIHSFFSLSTRLLSLLKSAGTNFSLSTSVLSTSADKLAKFDFAVKLDVCSFVN